MLPKVDMLFKSSYRLCELHFEEKYISKGSSRKRLMGDAVPTIFHRKTFVDTKRKHPEGYVSEPAKKLIILSGLYL